jgi:hypothetical protein
MPITVAAWSKACTFFARSNIEIVGAKRYLQQVHPSSEADIQGLLDSAQANLGYFLATFQSL